MKSFKSSLLGILVIGMLLTSCYSGKPCFDCKRHDRHEFKAETKPKHMTIQYLDAILAQSRLNEQLYRQQLMSMPFVSAEDVINYLNHGTIPKGYEPRKLFKDEEIGDRTCEDAIGQQGLRNENLGADNDNSPCEGLLPSEQRANGGEQEKNE